MVVGGRPVAGPAIVQAGVITIVVQGQVANQNPWLRQRMGYGVNTANIHISIFNVVRSRVGSRGSVGWVEGVAGGRMVVGENGGGWVGGCRTEGNEIWK